MACCAEVRVANGVVKMVRVVEAFECGAVVNPEHLRNQVEGAVAMGIGGALFEQIEFRQQPDPQPAAIPLPRAALHGYAGDRERAAGPERHRVRRIRAKRRLWA